EKGRARCEASLRSGRGENSRDCPQRCRSHEWGLLLLQSVLPLVLSREVGAWGDRVALEVVSESISRAAPPPNSKLSCHHAPPARFGNVININSLAVLSRLPKHFLPYHRYGDTGHSVMRTWKAIGAHLRGDGQKGFIYGSYSRASWDELPFCGACGVCGRVCALGGLWAFFS